MDKVNIPFPYLPLLCGQFEQLNADVEKPEDASSQLTYLKGRAVHYWKKAIERLERIERFVLLCYFVLGGIEVVQAK